MKYCFGDIVVVEDDLIGVVVTDWVNQDGIPNHDVYVRMYHAIKNYNESDMQRYMVRHKYLDDAELNWQENAIQAGELIDDGL